MFGSDNLVQDSAVISSVGISKEKEKCALIHQLISDRIFYQRMKCSLMWRYSIYNEKAAGFSREEEKGLLAAENKLVMLQYLEGITDG